VACFEDDFEACIARLRLPIAHRRATRTTNLLERLFVEERRRLKIIPNAWGEKPVLKLMFGAMIRAAERWRAVKVTDFERRQMAAPREELDQQYEARNGLGKTASADAAPKKIPSRNRDLTHRLMAFRCSDKLKKPCCSMAPNPACSFRTSENHRRTKLARFLWVSSFGRG